MKSPITGSYGSESLVSLAFYADGKKKTKKKGEGILRGTKVIPAQETASNGIGNGNGAWSRFRVFGFFFFYFLVDNNNRQQPFQLRATALCQSICSFDRRMQFPFTGDCFGTITLG